MSEEGVQESCATDVAFGCALYCVNVRGLIEDNVGIARVAINDCEALPGKRHCMWLGLLVPITLIAVHGSILEGAIYAKILQ